MVFLSDSGFESKTLVLRLIEDQAAHRVVAKTLQEMTASKNLNKF